MGVVKRGAMFHVKRKFGGCAMREWFHVKHDRIVEVQEIAVEVYCLSPTGCWAGVGVSRETPDS